MKKTVCLLLAGLMTIGALTGCGSSADDKKDDSAKTEATGEKKSDGFDTSSDITVVSREDGSGTRGAFIELFGIEEKQGDEIRADLQNLAKEKGAEVKFRPFNVILWRMKLQAISLNSRSCLPKRRPSVLICTLDILMMYMSCNQADPFL